MAVRPRIKSFTCTAGMEVASKVVVMYDSLFTSTLKKAHQMPIVG